MKINKGELVIPGIMAAFLAAYFVQVLAPAGLVEACKRFMSQEAIDAFFQAVPLENLTWPVYVGCALALGIVAILAMYACRESPAKKPGASMAKPALFVVMTVVYLVAMNWLGYTLSNCLYLLAVQLFLGSGARRAVLVAVIVSALLHVVMVQLIGLSVPQLTTPWFVL